jgi:signal transduction histidine kinase
MSSYQFHQRFVGGVPLNEQDSKDLKVENEKLKAELINLKAVNKQYLQNVAHQLTAPLGAIKWSIEALKDERVPLIRKSKLLSSIYSQATILVHLIKNFTLMSNLEADHELGQFREQAEAISVMHLAINLANDFQPQARDADIKVKVDDGSFHKVFGSKKLLIEKNLVAQAMSNIMENAVKYANPDTTILISAGGDEKTVAIVIESVGIPISNDEKSQLFTRGYRGKKAMQKVAAGTGIGLYLASRVMIFHNGKIGVETEGKLARFYLIFPKERLV